MVGLCPLSAIRPQMVGLADTTRFSQGSARLATMGFGAESLWDSLEFPKGMGSIPDGIGRFVPAPAARAPTT